MREEILEGKLPFPGKVLFSMYPNDVKIIKRFYRAVWLNYLENNETNSLYWYEQMGIKLYNDVVRRLSHNGWIVSRSYSGRRWASVELCIDKLLDFVTQEELSTVKAKYKYAKYTLKFEESTLVDAVRQNGEVKTTGIIRDGFRATGDTQFGYCMESLNKYEDTIIKNLTKSMTKIRRMYPEMRSEESSYDEVSTGIYNWHKENPLEVFTKGNNVSDSRGRAISSALSKVTNPISNKDFRSCLVIAY